MKATTLAAAAALAFASPSFAQNQSNTNADIDFGAVTGHFLSYGFNEAGEAAMQAEAKGFVYESMAECLQAGLDFHASFTSHQLFNAFDIATRSVCEANDFGSTLTNYSGSTRATSLMRSMQP